MALLLVLTQESLISLSVTPWSWIKSKVEFSLGQRKAEQNQRGRNRVSLLGPLAVLSLSSSALFKLHGISVLKTWNKETNKGKRTGDWEIDEWCGEPKIWSLEQEDTEESYWSVEAGWLDIGEVIVTEHWLLCVVEREMKRDGWKRESGKDTEGC